MTESNLKKVQENIIKKTNKLITIDKLKILINWILSNEIKNSQFYKIIYNLKNKGFLISLKKDIFLIKQPQKEYSEFDIENKFYWKLLKDHCTSDCKNARYLWWLTALEINYNDKIPEIPEEIIIFNNKKQAKEIVIFEKKVYFKKYQVNQKSIFTTLLKQTKKKRISENNFTYANMELSILESLYNIDEYNKTYIENLIIKVLKKQKKNFNIKNLEDILKTGKHNSSANRFLKIIQNSFPDLAKEVKRLIKKHGFIL